MSSGPFPKLRPRRPKRQSLLSRDLMNSFQQEGLLVLAENAGVWTGVRAATPEVEKQGTCTAHAPEMLVDCDSNHIGDPFAVCDGCINCSLQSQWDETVSSHLIYLDPDGPSFYSLRGFLEDHNIPFQVTETVSTVPIPESVTDDVLLNCLEPESSDQAIGDDWVGLNGTVPSAPIDVPTGRARLLRTQGKLGHLPRGTPLFRRGRVFSVQDL